MPLVVTTENRDFKPLGARGDYALEARERLRELGTDYITLLAEPVSEAGWGRTAWFSEGSAIARPLNSLNDAEASNLLDRLHAMRLEISKLADKIATPTRQVPADEELAQALRRLAVVPDDEHFVWSVDGKPLLIAWGMVFLSDARSEQAVIGEGLLPRTARPVGKVRLIDNQPVQPVPQRRYWPLLLWLLFIALVGAIDFLLLRACGVFVPPEGSLLRRVLPNACYATAASVNPALLDERRELEDKIRKAELDLARLQGDCAPPQQPFRRAQVEPPPPPPPPPPGPSIDQRLDRENAKTGQLQISLVWNGKEDLDLHVKCPGGELSFASAKKEACGGKLDVDMNNERDNVDAVENAFWPRPPNGNYEIYVVMYSRKGEPRRSVPFTVRVKRAGQPDQSFNKSVSTDGEKVTVYSFSIP
jgi:hypothetical protein